MTFNDYVLPNEALSKGDIDVNAFQHKPYLDQQIKDRGYKLVVVGNTFVYPIAGYSKKIKSLDELQPGSESPSLTIRLTSVVPCCCCSRSV